MKPFIRCTLKTAQETGKRKAAALFNYVNRKVKVSKIQVKGTRAYGGCLGADGR